MVVTTIPARHSVEVPTGYPLAGCSPAEPTSVSPADGIMSRRFWWVKSLVETCSVRLVSL